MYTALLYLQQLLSRLRGDQEGQGLVEYGLIIALVSVALIAALEALTGGLKGVYNSITNTLTGA